MIKTNAVNLLTIPLFEDTDDDLIRKHEEIAESYKNENFPPYWIGREFADLIRKGIQAEEKETRA